VTSIHNVQPDYDANKVVAPKEWVKEFIEADAPSYLEVYDENNALRREIEAHFKDRVVVADRLEQEATLFKVMRSERLVVIAILAFVVFLASFGVVSALTIIALEKDNDIKTLWAMGASNEQLRKLFFTNGMYITLSGWGTGMLLGTAIILLQKYVGLITLGSGYVQEYYPVTLKLEHFLLTTIIVLGIGTIMSLWSTKNVVRD